jgi:hypothetical protein
MTVLTLQDLRRFTAREVAGSTIEMAATIGSPRMPSQRKFLGGETPTSCKRRGHILFTRIVSQFSDPGVQHAAVTASICTDDGRANALVRRGSALGLTERLT